MNLLCLFLEENFASNNLGTTLKQRSVIAPQCISIKNGACENVMYFTRLSLETTKPRSARGENAATSSGRSAGYDMIGNQRDA